MRELDIESREKSQSWTQSDAGRTDRLRARQSGSVSCYRPVLSSTILDVETGERPPRFRKLVQPFGSGALGTYGNVCVEVGGWFSAESARLGYGLGGCV